MKTIYKGKSFPWTIYLDDSRRVIIVELLEGKIARYDTLSFVTLSDSIIKIRGKESDLSKVSDSEYKYVNHEFDISIQLKKVEYTDEIDHHRKKVFTYMAHDLISSLKKKDGFLEYKFDWKVNDDYIFYRDSLDTLDHIPEFIIKYEKAKEQFNINRNEDD